MSLKLADDEQLDKALYAWFIQQRSTGTPISGPPLQEKVKHFSTQLNTETADRDFKASTGWLEKFSLLYTFCLHFYLINIHIFDYPDSRLSELFTKVPMSPDIEVQLYATLTINSGIQEFVYSVTQV